MRPSNVRRTADSARAAHRENPLSPLFLASLLSLPLWAGIIYLLK